MGNEKHAPDSLKYQWRLAGLVQRAKWATSLDKTVSYLIIDRYYPKFGNARASISYLQEATGATRSNIVASARRIAAHGVISVLRQGSGTRPTEYALGFDLVADLPSGPTDRTTADTSDLGSLTNGTANYQDASSPTHRTTTSPAVHTTSASSSPLGRTQTVLPYAGLQPGIQVGTDIDCAPPSAPPGSATCGPTGADRTQGFEELWSAYGHRQKRADAKAFYEALAPSEDLHRAMINSAHVWRERWEAQGDPNAVRKTLSGWIRGEHFLEDPPTPYRGKERIAKALPISTKQPAAALVNVRPAAQIVALTVENATIAKALGKSILRVKFMSQGASGKTYEETIVLESRKKDEQDAGQRRLEELLAAVDIDSVDDADALIGGTLQAVERSGDLILLPADEWARGPRLTSLGLAG